MKNFDEKLAIKRVVAMINKYYKQSQKLMNLNVNKKELNDIVTNVDLFMEKNIIAELSRYYPTHSFKAEESGEQKIDSKAIFMNGLLTRLMELYILQQDYQISELLSLCKKIEKRF